MGIGKVGDETEKVGRKWRFGRILEILSIRKIRNVEGTLKKTISIFLCNEQNALKSNVLFIQVYCNTRHESLRTFNFHWKFWGILKKMIFFLLQLVKYIKMVRRTLHLSLASILDICVAFLAKYPHFYTSKLYKFATEHNFICS